AEVVRRRLADVGCTVADAATGAAAGGVAGDDVLVVSPPSWRPDLTRPADLVEEIVRLEGYDTIPVTLPRLPAGRGLTPAQRMHRAVTRALAYAGLTEVQTLPFVATDVADSFGLLAGDKRRWAIRVANPIAEDAANLRTFLLFGLVAAAVRNIGRGQQDLALFESGRVFREEPDTPVWVPRPPVDRRPSAEEIAALDSVLPKQARHVAALLTGRRDPAGWSTPGREVDWADAVDLAQVAAEAVGLTLTATAGDAMPWHPGRCAELTVDGRLVGFAGELHPRVLGDVGLPPRTVALELSLSVLVELATSAPPIVAPVISTYPPADRDVALVVPIRVPVAEVTEALREGAGDLLESLTLFDVFEGAQVDAGHRSLAFGLRLRAGDRTLTAAEVNAVRDAAVDLAAQRTGAALRA
ncbi:phenylalanine--tRNA ligase subunit beta, partial [Frankia sp. AiPs1]|uniref:phenylalanine--tRNA ligase subunit beta n=1 Tax=Frankia sp. AiPs1 TaxID=573493 RepID=UPI0020435E7C